MDHWWRRGETRRDEAEEKKEVEGRTFALHCIALLLFSKFVLVLVFVFVFIFVLIQYFIISLIAFRLSIVIIVRLIVYLLL